MWEAKANFVTIIEKHNMGSFYTLQPVHIEKLFYLHRRAFLKSLLWKNPQRDLSGSISIPNRNSKRRNWKDFIRWKIWDSFCCKRCNRGRLGWTAKNWGADKFPSFHRSGIMLDWSTMKSMVCSVIYSLKVLHFYRWRPCCQTTGITFGEIFAFFN